MKKLVLFLLFPFFLSALNYYSDEDAQKFSASFEKLPQNINLSEKKSIEIQISHPEDYKLKSVAYPYDESTFSWGKNQNLTKANSLKVTFEPKIEGKQYLNMPTIHLVSKTDPKKFVTLHPPLVAIEVQNDLSGKEYVFHPKDVLSMDLKGSVELDSKNTQTAMLEAQKDVIKIKKALEDKSAQKTLTYTLLILSILFLAIYIARKFVQREKAKPAHLKVDPTLWAKRSLKALSEKNLPKKGLFEEFYIELTQIIRSYIERQFNIKAPEQTTQEFLQEVIGKSAFDQTIKNLLEEFLKFADLVKFAKLHPEMSECFEAEKAALGFIEVSSERAMKPKSLE